MNKLKTKNTTNCELIFSLDLSLKVKNFCKEKDNTIPKQKESAEANRYHICSLWTKIKSNKKTDTEVAPPDNIYLIILILIIFCI